MEAKAPRTAITTAEFSVMLLRSWHHIASQSHKTSSETVLLFLSDHTMKYLVRAGYQWGGHPSFYLTILPSRTVPN